MGSKYKEFDKTLNPKGDFSKPSLEQLREGVKKYPKIAKHVNAHDEAAYKRNTAA